MSYKPLENHMRSVIGSLPTGTQFFLRDIIPNPPARLGRTLYEYVKCGEIPDVRYVNMVDGVEQYEKL